MKKKVAKKKRASKKRIARKTASAVKRSGPMASTKARESGVEVVEAFGEELKQLKPVARKITTVNRFKDNKGNWRRYWYVLFKGFDGREVRRSTGVEWRVNGRDDAKLVGEEIMRRYWEVEAPWRCRDAGYALTPEKHIERKYTEKEWMDRVGVPEKEVEAEEKTIDISAPAGQIDEVAEQIETILKKKESSEEIEPLEEIETRGSVGVVRPPAKVFTTEKDVWRIAAETGHPRVRLVQKHLGRERRKLMLPHSGFVGGVGKLVVCEEGERGMLALKKPYDRLFRTEGDRGYGTSRI